MRKQTNLNGGKRFQRPVVFIELNIYLKLGVGTLEVKRYINHVVI